MPASQISVAAIHYRVEVADLHAHLFRVTLTVAAPQPQQALSLPVWIPGSYLVREFSKNLQGLRAEQGGASVAVVQQDKQRWLLSCDSAQPLQVQYEVYAPPAWMQRVASLMAPVCAWRSKAKPISRAPSRSLLLK